MFDLYQSLEWGKKTDYKRKLAAHLGLTITTTSVYLQNEYFPAEHEDAVKEFNKTYKNK